VCSNRLAESVQTATTLPEHIFPMRQKTEPHLCHRETLDPIIMITEVLNGGALAKQCVGFAGCVKANVS
jgi:hypothetical protein